MKRREKRKINNKLIVEKIFFCIMLAVILSVDLKEKMTIHIATDEFGYWTAAANFLGWDWSNSAALNSYYSFGYSLFLTPLLLLIKNPIITYKAAIALNIVFVEMSFLLLFYIFKLLFSYCNEHIILCLSFLVMCYPANIVNIKFTLSECCLLFIFLVISVLLQKYSLSSNKYILFILFFFGGFIFFIHMRAIGVTVALICSVSTIMLFKCKIRESILNEIRIVGILLIVITAGLVIKEQLINVQYQHNNLTSINDIGGQTQKIEYLLSADGILSFVANFFGRLFYLGYSTILFIYFGVYSCIKELKRSWIEKQQGIFGLHLFFILSLIFAISISAIYMINLKHGRTDMLYYGRYSEYVIAPILLMGVKEFLYNKHSNIFILFFSFIQMILSIIVSKLVIYFEMSSMLDISIPAFYYWIKKNNYSTEAYLSGTMITIGVIISIYILIKYAFNKFLDNKNAVYAVYIVSFFIVCYWIFLGHNSYKISDLHKHDEEYIQIYQIINNNMNSETEIFYCFLEDDVNEAYSFQGIDRIQFCLRDKIIQFCNMNNYDNIPPNSIIIIRSDSNCLNGIINKPKELDTNKEFSVYKN